MILTEKDRDQGSGIRDQGPWHRGFTLVELLVVVGMIAVIIAALTTAVAGAQERARVQKALSEVKVVSQAILAYENYDQGGGRHELPTLNKQPANKSSIGFILGAGGDAQSGGKIPVMLMAALTSGGDMLDPWGTPYRVTIKESSFSIKPGAASGNLQTGFFLPNWYRLGKGER